MSSSGQKPCKVLFVDDERDFLAMIQRTMGALSQDSWEIHTADSAGQALSVLQAHPIQLVVLDVQMPVIDGLQFLSILNRRFPDLQKVVLTGYATEAYRNGCLSNGADLFLEKPKSRQEQEHLYSALNELLKWTPEPGFRGVLRRVGLEDILQMECLGRSSSVLEVKGGSKTGAIYIRDGEIIHAECGDRTGEQAFQRLLRLKGGEFQFKPFVDPGDRTIEGSWEFLLMEASRLRDEVAETGESDTVMKTAAEFGLPPSTADAPSPAEPEAATPESGEPTVELEAIAEPAGQRREDVVEGERRVVDEVLMCSTDGDVLYEWQCHNSEFWINCLEFISQKSRQAAQGLDLGDFERIELEEQDNRLVAVILPDRGVLVRAHSTREKPAPGDVVPDPSLRPTIEPRRLSK